MVTCASGGVYGGVYVGVYSGGCRYGIGDVLQWWALVAPFGVIGVWQWPSVLLVNPPCSSFVLLTNKSPKGHRFKKMHQRL